MTKKKPSASYFQTLVLGFFSALPLLVTIARYLSTTSDVERNLYTSNYFPLAVMFSLTLLLMFQLALTAIANKR